MLRIRTCDAAPAYRFITHQLEFQASDGIGNFGKANRRSSEGDISCCDIIAGSFYTIRVINDNIKLLDTAAYTDTIANTIRRPYGSLVRTRS